MVELTCLWLEDDPLYNAGHGAVLDENGQCVLEAAIMTNDKSCGATAGLKSVKNPIRLARLIMDKTPHPKLIGEPAEQIAEKYGLEKVENEYFKSPHRLVQWEEEGNHRKEKGMGTIGCVVRDIHGNMAVGTSTGGLVRKMAGRVGDTPVIGAGTYCNSFAAVSGTGIGEYFIRNNIAAQVCARMEFGQCTLQTAVKAIVATWPPDVGGLIAVDQHNNIQMEFNTARMYRGGASSNGYYFIGVTDT